MEENFQEIEETKSFKIILVCKNYLVVQNERGNNIRIHSPILENSDLILNIGDKIKINKKGVFQDGR